ncbi:MAG: hypothetical protein CVU42_02160 [Chloroflexi bacterium HGW-Chloroflexi-4]|jgi:PAS domain S-box-containing protein|nr:MAG: hypothetical protein CVU42_02160 [Chloroflexi bacterium HGW-Chloroflexi-4]
MAQEILLNLHCHSMFSDGELTPESLAELLAAKNVRYASLTDHDTIEGQHRFQTALKKLGVEFIPGVELTTFLNGQEVHLLGYGFNVDDPDLNSTMLSLRQSKALDNVSIAGSMRKRSANHIDSDKIHHRTTVQSGTIETRDAIRLLHQAGGCVLLAHPLTINKDPEKLIPIIKKLKALGLDGIEAVYTEYSQSDQKMLRDCADAEDLLVSAGTDFHAKLHDLSVELERERWVKLRSKIFSGQGFLRSTKSNFIDQSGHQAAPHKTTERHHHFQKRSFILRIFLPTFLAIALFLTAIWVFVIPSFENTLLDRKRELIRELTNSAISILTSYHKEELAGSLYREEAQALAIDRVQSLRYGAEDKDYFWIQDLKPTMIMHPYRPELNGEDLLDFKDARGVRIFVEFSNLVQREGEGYIDYVWQWKDDPDRLEPKESFVKLFEPWDWIIGTGIYIDDVNQEIAKIEKDITTTSVVVSVIIILLLLYVLQQSLQIEKGRQDVLDELKESTERYHTVIETMTEGTLLVIDNRCRYANSTFINMIGYSETQLPFLDLEDILPRSPENQEIWENVAQTDATKVSLGKAVDGFLQNKEGQLIDCILMLNPIQYANQEGFILLARDIAHQSNFVASDGLSKAVKIIDVGVFRARAVRRGVFLEINPAGYGLLPEECKTDGAQPSLADLFPDTFEFDHFINDLKRKGQINEYILKLNASNDRSLTIALSATLELDEAGQPYLITGMLKDVTQTQKLLADREAQINKLQASLLFFHEPLSKLERALVTGETNTTIQQVSKRMSDKNMSAALITADNGDALGIITDHDLRDRVIAQKTDSNKPAFSVMTSPIVRINENAMIYEAIIKMEEKGVRHLAVENDSGQIVNLVDSKMLAQFPRYGAYILTQEIAKTTTLDDLVTTNQRKNKAVKVLIESSHNVRHATSMLSSIYDASTERLINFALEEFGPPPTPFAFIGMGSQGRQEPTLVTDQDNGIIYMASAEHQPYFLALGERISQGLDAIGASYCDGKVMASNPAWCKPLEAWKRDFNLRINNPEAQQMVDLSIFFDFRLIHGDMQLVQDLRKHLSLSLQDRHDFFHLFAKQAQKFKAPTRGISSGLLGIGSVDSGEREINLKDLIMPIVNFARLYALKNNIQQTNTLERMSILAERGIISTNTCDEMSTTYEYVLLMRLKNQISQIDENQQPDNTVQLGKLADLHQTRLHEALALISVLQKRISFDFLGGIQ